MFDEALELVAPVFELTLEPAFEAVLELGVEVISELVAEVAGESVEEPGFAEALESSCAELCPEDALLWSEPGLAVVEPEEGVLVGIDVFWLSLWLLELVSLGAVVEFEVGEGVSPSELSLPPLVASWDEPEPEPELESEPEPDS